MTSHMYKGMVIDLYPAAYKVSTVLKGGTKQVQLNRTGVLTAGIFTPFLNKTEAFDNAKMEIDRSYTEDGMQATRCTTCNKYIQQKQYQCKPCMGKPSSTPVYNLHVIHRVHGVGHIEVEAHSREQARLIAQQDCIVLFCEAKQQDFIIHSKPTLNT